MAIIISLLLLYSLKLILARGTLIGSRFFAGDTVDSAREHFCASVWFAIEHDELQCGTSIAHAHVCLKQSNVMSDATARVPNVSLYAHALSHLVDPCREHFSILRNEWINIEQHRTSSPNPMFIS